MISTNYNPAWANRMRGNMDESTLANIPESDARDICYKCQKPMNTGDLVDMDYSGQAIAHLKCGAAPQLSITGQIEVERF